MDDKEQTRQVLQKVMGYFVLEETATGWRTPEFPKGMNAPAGFHWPIAFWNTDGECWMTRDIATDPIVFDPLHNMNDAWRIVEYIHKTRLFSNRRVFLREIQRLVTRDSTLESGMLLDWPDAFFFVIPEIICLAALKATEVGSIEIP